MNRNRSPHTQRGVKFFKYHYTRDIRFIRTYGRREGAQFDVRPDRGQSHIEVYRITPDGKRVVIVGSMLLVWTPEFTVQLINSLGYTAQIIPY